MRLRTLNSGARRPRTANDRLTAYWREMEGMNEIEARQPLI